MHLASVAHVVGSSAGAAAGLRVATVLARRGRTVAAAPGVVSSLPGFLPAQPCTCGAMTRRMERAKTTTETEERAVARATGQL